MGVEMVLQQPPAIVARAEATADWMKLPGIEEFAAALKQAVKDAREKNAVGRVMGWEIIRQCYEYGNRPEVRARVEAMNHALDGGIRRGRPCAAYRLAMEAIAGRCGVCLRTMYRWQAGFNELLRSGELRPNEFCDIMSQNSSQLADRLDEIEARIEAKRTKASGADDCDDEAPGSEEPLKPEVYGEQLGHSFLRKARLEESLNPAVVRGLLKALCPVLERHGYSVFCRNKRSSA